MEQDRCVVLSSGVAEWEASEWGLAPAVIVFAPHAEPDNLMQSVSRATV